MSKKTLILATIVTLVLSFSSICFAENNVMHDVKNTAGNTGNAITNTAGAIGSGVETIANDAGNAIKDTAGAVGNGVQNIANNSGNELKKSGEKMSNEGNNIAKANENNNNGYTAQRTGINNMMNNSTFWTWAIIALVAVGIIAAIIYYTSQNNSEHNRY